MPLDQSPIGSLAVFRYIDHATVAEHRAALGLKVFTRNTDRVIGEIYRFTDPQRALQILDEYEGHRFKRKRVTIIQEDGKSITSWIYLYARSVKRHPRISSGDYIQYRNSF
jgi:gamma-glutamylcyclotransferase (GGCT)/AIG2-like uncharacterized protein YtfP